MIWSRLACGSWTRRRASRSRSASGTSPPGRAPVVRSVSSAARPSAPACMVEAKSGERPASAEPISSVRVRIDVGSSTVTGPSRVSRSIGSPARISARDRRATLSSGDPDGLDHQVVDSAGPRQRGDSGGVRANLGQARFVVCCPLRKQSHRAPRRAPRRHGRSLRRCRRCHRPLPGTQDQPGEAQERGGRGSPSRGSPWP